MTVLYIVQSTYILFLQAFLEKISDMRAEGRYRTFLDMVPTENIRNGYCYNFISVKLALLFKKKHTDEKTFLDQVQKISDIVVQCKAVSCV